MTGDPIMLIPIAQLTADERYQARGDGLSEAHVQLLMESDPQAWPPVLVEPMGDNTYGLRDGFHRHETASRLGLSALLCRVVDGAGYPEAVAANLTHGLPLSKADRKDAARWWAEREPDLSYREIGRRVGLSDKTVKAAITEDERPQAQRSAPDPAARLVSHLIRTYEAGSPGVRALQREIAAYDDEWRGYIAEALARLGEELTEAAAPYLEE